MMDIIIEATIEATWSWSKKPEIFLLVSYEGKLYWERIMSHEQASYYNSKNITVYKTNLFFSVQKDLAHGVLPRFYNFKKEHLDFLKKEIPQND